MVVPFSGDVDAGRAALARMGAIAHGRCDELILVDNTAEALGLEATMDWARIVRAPLEGSSHYARNVGAEHARNPWLLFIDADCAPAPDVIDAYFGEWPDERVGALAGAILGDPEQPGAIPRYARSRGHVEQKRQVEVGERPSGGTGNMLVRRAAWAAVGGFHEGVRSGGDPEFTWRLQDVGWTFGFRAEPLVLHSHLANVREMLSQARRHAAGRAWLNRRYHGCRPQPWVAVRLARCAAGVLVWTFSGRFERARWKWIDARWSLADARGYRTSNAVPKRAGATPRSEPDVVVLADGFPALSETFIAGEVRALEAGSRRVRIESFMRPFRPERSIRREMDVTYMEDDSHIAKVRDLIWLLARHPLGSAQDLFLRRRWRRQESVWPLRSLAPAARRLERSGAGPHLHAHFAAGSALAALRLARLLGLTYSVTAHAHEIYRDRMNLEEKLDGAAFTTSGCDYTVRELRHLVPLAADRIHKVVMGVDPESFIRRTPHESRGVALAVGRLVPKKGFEYLVDAAALVGPHLREMVIVGDGPLRDALECRIADLGLGEKVRLTGWLDPDGVRELLARADLLAAPCVIAPDGDRDSMPVVVKEALAMEVPVVASEEVGLPEVVRPAWGRLVPPREPEALAAAISELLALSPEERRDMGRRGRSFVSEHCNVWAEGARLSDLIAAAEG